MPVEIRELIIKATITDDSSAQDQASDQQDASGKEEIINECIEQIMQVLKSKTER